MSDYRKGLDEASVEVRPTAWFVFKISLCAMLIAAGLSVIGYGFGWFGESARVVQEQFGARALLAKYELFKDMSAQLDKKVADITVYQGRMTAMNETYKDVPRAKWPREDREQYNIWSSEVAGVKASYNSLAADYNAQMSKFNYAFANVGQLPQGAEKPLPREYKPYISQ